uniref:hypothetical protein n=1 Tax=Prevotella sp. TaxID=59823 RepID=UPI0040254978
MGTQFLLNLGKQQIQLLQQQQPTRFAHIALLLQGKQQNTRLRQDITPVEISRKCVQGEALFIVVSLAATLGQHGPRRGDVPAKLFHYMALFLAMA